MFIARKLGCSYSNIDIPFHEKFIILNRFKPGKRIRTDSTVLWIGNTPKLKWGITQYSLANVFVTKFDYLLYWDITGAPRHIAGQALFCVNIGNGWNNVCNNCFNYSYLYWVKWRLFWINSDFELQIYQVTYRILVLLYYTLYIYLGDEIYSGAHACKCWRQAGLILLYCCDRERGAWKVKLILIGMSSVKVLM